MYHPKKILPIDIQTRRIKISYQEYFEVYYQHGRERNFKIEYGDITSSWEEVGDLKIKLANQINKSLNLKK